MSGGIFRSLVRHRVINWRRRAQVRVRVQMRASVRVQRARLTLQKPLRQGSRSWTEMVARPARVLDLLRRHGRHRGCQCYRYLQDAAAERHCLRRLASSSRVCQRPTPGSESNYIGFSGAKRGDGGRKAHLVQLAACILLASVVDVLLDLACSCELGPLLVLFLLGLSLVFLNVLEKRQT